MFTLEGCRARRKRLWDCVPESVEWLLAADPRHVRYLSGFMVNPFSFSHGERGWLLLEREQGATLLADNFAIRSAIGEIFADREVVEAWYNHQTSVINRDHALLAALNSVAERLYGREGAVEAEWLPVGAWEILGLDRESHSVTDEGRDGVEPGRAVDLGTLIRGLRRQKEVDEISLLEMCMRATEAGHVRAREVIRQGMSEFDVYCAVQQAALEAAGRPAIVYGDFRANNAQMPKAGGLPTGYRLQAGDLFILDYSVVIDGYRSDFTNTLAVGDASDEQRMLMSVLQSAMEHGEAVLNPGTPAKEVYAAASTPIRESGLGAGIPHHAGHGLGLGHPEPPILVSESDDVLMVGDVITLEPGLYIEGIGGIRIEHNYLIMEDGYQRLSNHTISLD